MHFTEQISAAWAIVLLVDSLFGVTIGVVGGAAYGSRRGVLLAPAADDPLSAGARDIYRVCIRDDGRYPRCRPRGEDRPAADPRGHDGPEPCERQVDR